MIQIGCCSFPIPASFLHRRKPTLNVNLRQFLKEMKTRSFTFIWEPRGKWEGREVKRLCTELNIIPCLDPFEETSIPGDLLYARLHGEKGYRYTYSETEIKELIEIGKSYPSDLLHV